MARSTDQYLHMLLALLPRGTAWNRGSQSSLASMLGGWAEELARLDERCENLIDEADPRTTLELLAAWERNAGLPDVCTGPLDTIAERRDALIGRLAYRGGQSRQYFIDLAAALEYAATITEFSPFVAGSSAGDSLTNGDWAFTWRVNAPETTIRSFTAGSYAGEELRTWGNDLLECALGRYKPAHSIVLFSYSS
jgi:uncharacterized protein YmfQ (DUF2313 family)